jgi:hypothetical protein
MSEGRTHAAFASPYDLRDALKRLAADGVSSKDIEIRSSAPLDHDVFPDGAGVHSRMPWMALLGAFGGGTAFFLMVKLTSEAYPLPTGHMAIVALPTAGVITFEGIAIGAIIFTVATVLYECGLPALFRSRQGPLDHHLADDHVLLSVRCDEGASKAWAAGALETARD